MADTPYIDTVQHNETAARRGWSRKQYELYVKKIINNRETV